ncbi:two-component sensor histidine kinase [Micromonospora sp. C32]|uniref:sensor histidine kinase n=1 Tax=unclassified Micromonospora TaxID=2617518 RepID=UPI001B367BC5|nr:MULTISPECIES: histidine kinase [unclassified Micromonospora]MBQ1045701.1 two-component sensor histidine kinase [Micromonospora sp. C72]MBQ1056997.1 two-component sensor histidine kinase [Micromonospora sp. C32]
MEPRERQRRALDLLLWAVLAAPVAYGRLTPPWHADELPPLAAALALLGAAVWIGRRWPLVAVLAVVAGSLVDGNVVFAIPVFGYLAGRRSDRAAPAAAVFAAIAVTGSVLNLGLLGTEPSTWFLLSSVLLFAGVFPWLLGRLRRQHRALADAGLRHAQAERRAEVERVRLRERARIAQDMHDSLGHDLSLIALRAGALELAPDLSPAHRAAAGELRASVAAATERLHDVIGVLREEHTLRPPGETVADVVDGARDAGMTVDLRADDADLPPLPAHAAQRVVREALTNAARYAPGAPVTVDVAREADAVTVAVVNAPPPAGPLPGPPSHGSGLLALRERVRLTGGALDAGPRDGGWAVTARLPLDGLTAPRPGDVDGRTDADLLAGVGVPPRGEPGDAARRLREARRRVRRSLLVAIGAPAGLALVLALVYYPLATAGAVLDRAGYERLRLGEPRDTLGLPRRQADPPATGAAPGCEFYTDGNFPFAQAAWRLCFADGRLVSKEQIEP